MLGIYSWKNWDAIVLQAPNNLGDTLAGACAPLAFLWLTIAVFLQKDELQAQRKELSLSRKALEVQAQELRESVEQFKKQNLLYEDEINLTRKAIIESNIYNKKRILISEVIQIFNTMCGVTVIITGNSKFYNQHISNSEKTFPNIEVFRTTKDKFEINSINYLEDYIYTIKIALNLNFVDLIKITLLRNESILGIELKINYVIKELEILIKEMMLCNKISEAEQIKKSGVLEFLTFFTVDEVADNAN